MLATQVSSFFYKRNSVPTASDKHAEAAMLDPSNSATLVSTSFQLQVQTPSSFLPLTELQIFGGGKE